MLFIKQAFLQPKLRISYARLKPKLMLIYKNLNENFSENPDEREHGHRPERRDGAPLNRVT